MRKYIPYALLLVLMAFIVYQCENTKEQNKLSEANYKALNDTVVKYKNKLGTITASKKALQLDKEEMQSVLFDKDKELKALAKEFSEVKAVVKYNTVTKFDTIYAAFDKPLDSLPTFERSGAKFTDWYSLGYKVNNQGLTIEPFETWTETTIITGFKKKWLLGEQTLTTDIANSNPYIDVIEIKSAVLVIPEPWYKKWYVWLAAGAAGGLFIK